MTLTYAFIGIVGLHLSSTPARMLRADESCGARTLVPILDLKQRRGTFNISRAGTTLPTMDIKTWGKSVLHYGGIKG